MVYNSNLWIKSLVIPKKGPWSGRVIMARFHLRTCSATATL